MIRHATTGDLDGIFDLLKKYDFNVMSPSEMFSGIPFVAIEDGKVVGFLWCMVSCRVGFCNILVVDEDYRRKTEHGRSEIGVELGIEVMKEMHVRGVTKFVTVVGDRPWRDSLLRLYRDYLGMEEFPCTVGLTGEPFKVLKKLEALK